MIVVMLELIAKGHWHAWKRFESPGLHQRLRALRAEDGLTPTAWRSLQHEKLRNLMAHASQQVPYYGELFRSAGFQPGSASMIDDFVRIPVLAKDTIRKEGEKLIALQSDRSKLIPNATGGSTGTPLRFYQDGFYKEISAALQAHVPEWWGIRPYDGTACVWGSDQDLKSMGARDRFYMWRSRTRILDAFRMDEQKLDQYTRMLSRWQPPLLKGYASSLEALAKYVAAQKRDKLRFKTIVSSAEKLWPRQRRLIEETFQSPVYDFYGSREVNNLAAECAEEGRLHLITTWRYVEIVDDNGTPVPPGTLGHVAVTDLSNFGMPFIRYLNGDAARWALEPCPCGRPSPTIEALEGRVSDLIRAPNGEIVHGEFFTHLFYDCAEILQFQVHQVSLDRLILRCVPDGQTPERFLEGVVQRIRERMGESVNVEVEVCEDIPVPRSGKHRFTISDLDPQTICTPPVPSGRN